MDPRGGGNTWTIVKVQRPVHDAHDADNVDGLQSVKTRFTAYTFDATKLADQNDQNDQKDILPDKSPWSSKAVWIIPGKCPARPC